MAEHPTGAVAPPKLPARSLEPASLPDHDLDDEATFERLAFGLDLSGRVAESIEFDQCQFRGADLSGTSLPRATFRDCLAERTNLANFHAEKSSMNRVQVTASRMTGLNWLDGSLHDVLVTGSRADLSVFRFTRFRNVVFQDCNLSQPDFQNADLSGATFVDCDLSGAQFSYAKLTGARFHHCVLAGIGGATSFAGATLTSQDLMEFARSLAAGLGIQIEDD